MKRVWIVLIIGLIIGACSFLGGSIPLLGGPNAASQKETQDGMTLQAETQQALIQTQVAEGLAKITGGQNPAANPGNTPQNAVGGPTASATGQPAGAEETRTAEKTAVMAQLLTAAALTPIPAAGQTGGGFTSPSSAIDPKASDGTDFTGAHFYAWGQWTPTTYGVTIELTGAVGGDIGKNLIMKVNKQAMDKCIVPMEYPNRLYCTGKPFNGGKLPIEIYEKVNEQEVLRFVETYPFPSWTATPTKMPTKNRATKTPEA